MGDVRRRWRGRQWGRGGRWGRRQWGGGKAEIGGDGEGREEGARGGEISQMDMMGCLGRHSLWVLINSCKQIECLG